MPKLTVFDPKGPVRLTRVQAERLWIFEHTRNGETIIPNLLRRVPCSAGAEYLLHTGAKLYRDQRGFRVMGYAHDGSDVTNALTAAGLA